MSRMMLYFEICRASYGAISWPYLESLPILKLHYIYRAAQVVNLRASIEDIANANAAFVGGKKRVEEMQRQLGLLSWERPKTDVKKTKEWARKYRRKFKALKAKRKANGGKEK